MNLLRGSRMSFSAYTRYQVEGRYIFFQLLHIMYDQYAKFQLCSLKNKIFHEVAEGVQDVVLAVHLVPVGRLRPTSSTARRCT